LEIVVGVTCATFLIGAMAIVFSKRGRNFVAEKWQKMMGYNRVQHEEHDQPNKYASTSLVEEE